ncbi:aminotransferase class IV [Paenibacillus sp. IB182496]|uniref:Aminotransferase class IV n=1 Tax=Paenibacillus sabuli TaxID=2772509 RepID=A0A927GUI9_9BACL|nr:aminotransferase class IV [Paenibacillus sabuli]MBD2848401.1 aminotransferase class IV [Paenibacillus sabuli]
MMKVGYNGSVLDADQAVLSVYEHGFLYGLGLFETLRTYGGEPWLLERHLARLQEGCRALGICYEADPDVIREWLRRLMDACGLEEAYVRLTVSAGVGELGLPSGDYEAPNAILLVKPLPALPGRLDTHGKPLRLLRLPRNTPEGGVRMKSLHYMNNILAKRELAAAGPPEAEGLMLTQDGWLAEGIVSNLFFVREGVVCTPEIGTGILPGITRAKVLELAHAAGVSCGEGRYRPDLLFEADEIWVTNAIQELVPITAIIGTDGTKTTIGAGQSGPICRRLLQLYREQAWRAVGAAQPQGEEGRR